MISYFRLVVSYLLFTSLVKQASAACSPNCVIPSCSVGDGCSVDCKAGYGRNGLYCAACAAATHCDQSSSCNQGYTTKCDTKCLPNYVLVSYVCQPCDDHCTSGCKDQGPSKCDSSCETGYSLSTATYTCLYCDVNCDTTTGTGCANKGAGYCDGNCKSGYAVNSNFNCIESGCDVHCTGTCDANGAGYCDDVCAVGYTLNSDTHHCDPVCSPHCKPTHGCTTEGPGFCDDECEDHYYYKQLVSENPDINGKHICLACDPNCMDTSCPGAGLCESMCKGGYMFDATLKKCLACDSHCDPGHKCATAGKCDGTGASCVPLYTLVNDNCFACAGNCRSACDVSGPSLCDPCPSGDTTCTECASGYELRPAIGDTTKYACYLIE